MTPREYYDRAFRSLAWMFGSLVFCITLFSLYPFVEGHGALCVLMLVALDFAFCAWLVRIAERVGGAG